MKITIVAVATIDGKLARNEKHFVDWSSPEDKKVFYGATKQTGLLILGHNTFSTFPAPLPGRLHIVLTRDPGKQKNIPGVVEYTNKKPQEIVEDLEVRGYKEAVLAGGAEVNALFLKAGLVNEIWLTIEPLIFGQGIDLFRGTDFNVRAKLLAVKQLNDGGTLHLKYEVTWADDGR